MKKTLLALAVVAAAGSVNAAEILKTDNGSVDFYGQLRTELKFLDGNDHSADLSSGSSRMGIDAQYALTDELSILGLVEVGVRDNSDVNVRQHIFGFATKDAGTVKFGKQWTTSDDVYGADYSYFFGGSALFYGTLNGAEHDSHIKYSLEQDNFWLKAGIGLDENDTNNELYELFVGTTVADNLALHAGIGQDTYHSYDEDTEALIADVTNTYFEVTAEYTFGDALVGATYYYAELENNNGNQKVDSNGLSLAGMVKVADKTTMYAGYEFVKLDANNSAVEFFETDEDDSNVFYLGAEYKMASWARVYAEYGYADGATLGFSNKASDTFVPAQIADGESNFAIGARVYW
ncbi:porin [Vibrio sp. 10N.286.49.B3]|uniref:porin n=1 Tax=Vibrio sp. 10N.286.49.B3 TaxID=1880855 RepID=UPI000C85A395|nr:porin [Vibrio sp. 10N.286.49.B3]PMH44979.1 porin [Vibrio sp. 10N.286.49.B3]